MESIRRLAETVNRFFGGPIMLIGILAVGVLLTIRTGFVQICRLPYALGYAVRQIVPGKEKHSGKKPRRSEVTPFQAVCTALSGTLGTGNIAGVGAAIALGGAGALFWMWVGALFGMGIKYAEILLSMKTRVRRADGWQGGPMYYLGCLKGGQWLAGAFAVFCLGSSFCMGNMAQSNTAAAALRAVFPLSERGIRLIFLGISLLIGFVIIGGVKRIACTTEYLVPFMAIVYLGSCLAVIGINASRLPGVFGEIFASAFSLRSVVGGGTGTVMMRAMRIGVTRGVFTNEAGLGSAPIAHAAADNPQPSKQSLWGMFEVFLDTVVMCTLTGLVVLIPGVPIGGGEDGAAVTLGAFSRYLGDGATALIGLSTALFAVASIIGWSYYGEICIRWLTRCNGYVLLYRLCYTAAVYVGAVSSIGFVWELSDLCNSLMMAVNLTGVVLLSGMVQQESKRLWKSVGQESLTQKS